MTEPSPPRRVRFPFLLGFAVLVLLAVLAMAAVRSWHDLAAQRAREAAVEASIARTEAEVRGLEERIRRLKDDPFTLERLARRELGLVRAEDLVMVFPEGPLPAALPAPAVTEPPERPVVPPQPDGEGPAAAPRSVEPAPPIAPGEAAAQLPAVPVAATQAAAALGAADR